MFHSISWLKKKLKQVFKMTPIPFEMDFHSQKNIQCININVFLHDNHRMFTILVSSSFTYHVTILIEWTLGFFEFLTQGVFFAATKIPATAGPRWNKTSLIPSRWNKTTDQLSFGEAKGFESQCSFLRPKHLEIGPRPGPTRKGSIPIPTIHFGVFRIPTQL